jgi:hypothetical protein
VYDSVEIDNSLPVQAEVFEDKLFIANSHRIDKECYVRAAGYLTVPESYRHENENYGPSYHVRTVTDSIGFAHVHYHAPSGVVGSVDISIDIIPSGAVGSVVVSTDITLLSKTREAYYFADEYYFYGYLLDSGEVKTSGEVDITVPSGCVSPSSIELYYIGEFTNSLYDGTDLDPIHPVAFSSGEPPYVGFEVSDNSAPYMIKYPKDINSTKLDGRNSYGS